LVSHLRRLALLRCQPVRCRRVQATGPTWAAASP